MTSPNEYEQALGEAHQLALEAVRGQAIHRRYKFWLAHTDGILTALEELNIANADLEAARKRMPVQFVGLAAQTTPLPLYQTIRSYCDKFAIPFPTNKARKYVQVAIDLVFEVQDKMLRYMEAGIDEGAT